MGRKAVFKLFHELIFYHSVWNGLGILVDDDTLDPEVHRLHVLQHRLLVVQPLLGQHQWGVLIIERLPNRGARSSLVANKHFIEIMAHQS